MGLKWRFGETNKQDIYKYLMQPEMQILYFQEDNKEES